MDNPRGHRRSVDCDVTEVPEMVERVARAIAQIYGDEVDTAEFEAARAAIAAMMTPTEAMIKAGDEWLVNADCRTEASQIYRSMIRQAVEK